MQGPLSRYTVTYDYLGRREQLQSAARMRRDGLIEAIEHSDQRIAALRSEKESLPVGSAKRRPLETEIRQLSKKRGEAQEMLLRYAEWMEREEEHLKMLCAYRELARSGRGKYAASEKMPPLWFRVVAVTFWIVAILILMGILPRG